MLLSFSYRQVFSMLAAAHSVPESRHTALRGRIQHFQKLGVPDGVRTGRGTPAQYGPAQLLDLLIAFEVTHLGLTPDRAVRLVQANRKEVAAATAVVANRLLKGEGKGIFMIFAPHGFDLREEEDENPTQMRTSEADDVRDFLRQNERRHVALAIFSLTFLIDVICIAAEENGVSRGHALKALDDWSRSVFKMLPRKVEDLRMNSAQRRARADLRSGKLKL